MSPFLGCLVLALLCLGLGLGISYGCAAAVATATTLSSLSSISSSTELSSLESQTKIDYDPNKSHYRLMVLVLASDNHQIYRNCRAVWQKYMNLHPDVRVFLVYGSPGPSLDDRGINDLVYENIPEAENNSVWKMARAFAHVDSHFTFDFFLRTNVSTFWDWPKLLSNLNTFPATNILVGDGPFLNEYVSGTDLIVHGAMIKEFLKYEAELNPNICEDHALGLIFHGRLGAQMIPSGPRICFLTHFSDPQQDAAQIDAAIQMGRSNGADHYRVKSETNREIVDIAVYQRLLKIIYGIQ